MSKDLKTRIESYLESHSICTVATVDGDKPHASAVEYVNAGTTLYFMTFPKSHKTQNMRANPAVAITVNESVLDMRGTQGIQYYGKAMIVEDADVAEKARKMFLHKFILFGLIGWDLKKALFVEVTPERIDFIDYKKKFGHKDILTEF